MAQSYDQHLDNDRCMELLYACINHISVAENTSTLLGILINHIGFTEEELVKYFGYSQSDIDDFNAADEDDDDTTDEDDESGSWRPDND